MAEVTPGEKESFHLTEHHCPICSAAEACTGLCSAEQELFESVLGTEAQVERIEHRLTGGAHCIYRISR